ncbi:hypothetical protein NDU88_004662 [Pleurodeles waltl]|uniref:Uncharacterized protein n=1 Tax=Pleurodeles waltl TaxID=8319 RepID=A0AAV7LIZ5_PLEWA|nr:hypothetical protein NDU88_004662 [Pleurodeles waltl]
MGFFSQEHQPGTIIQEENNCWSMEDLKEGIPKEEGTETLDRTPVAEEPGREKTETCHRSLEDRPLNRDWIKVKGGNNSGEMTHPLYSDPQEENYTGSLEEEEETWSEEWWIPTQSDNALQPATT